MVLAGRHAGSDRSSQRADSRRGISTRIAGKEQTARLGVRAWGVLMSGSRMPFHGLDYRLREFRRVRRFREHGNSLATGQSMVVAATAGFGADWPVEPPGLAQ